MLYLATFVNPDVVQMPATSQCATAHVTSSLAKDQIGRLVMSVFRHKSTYFRAFQDSIVTDIVASAYSAGGRPGRHPPFRTSSLWGKGGKIPIFANPLPC